MGGLVPGLTKKPSPAKNWEDGRGPVGAMEIQENLARKRNPKKVSGEEEKPKQTKGGGIRMTSSSQKRRKKENCRGNLEEKGASKQWRGPTAGRGKRRTKLSERS